MPDETPKTKGALPRRTEEATCPEPGAENLSGKETEACLSLARLRFCFLVLPIQNRERKGCKWNERRRSMTAMWPWEGRSSPLPAISCRCSTPQESSPSIWRSAPPPGSSTSPTWGSWSSPALTPWPTSTICSPTTSPTCTTGRSATPPCATIGGLCGRPHRLQGPGGGLSGGGQRRQPG